MNIHLIITPQEQQAIINALAFYNDVWAKEALHDDDSIDQWRLAFREDNQGIGAVDSLATKVATLK